MCLNVYKTYGVDSEFSQAATWQENPLFVEKLKKQLFFSFWAQNTVCAKWLIIEAQNDSLKTFLCVWRVYTTRKQAHGMCLNVHGICDVDSEFSHAVTWQENPLFVEKR